MNRIAPGAYSKGHGSRGAPSGEGRGLAEASRWRGGLARARSFIELRTLLAILCVAGCGWLFAWIADEVTEGDSHALDRWLLLALRDPSDARDPLGPGWLEEFGRDVTALGGVGVLAGMTLAAFGLLWLQGKRGRAALVLVSVLGGQALSTLFKLGFDRPRPDLVPHGAMVYTASFPSGHSMMAAVTYLTLGALIAQSQERRALRIYIMTLAALVTIAVGVSRVYLGVHWPSDVLAGWAAGAAWATACLVAGQAIGRRRKARAGGLRPGIGAVSGGGDG